MKSKENIISSPLALCSLFPLLTLCSFYFLLLHVFDCKMVTFSFFIIEHVYTYISRHMFLISHSHVQYPWYSLSNGCWLKKDPPNLGGVFKTPPFSGDQQALLQTPQDVAPRAGNGKAPLDYSIKGITWSISGKKTNIDFNCSISFYGFQHALSFLSHDRVHRGHDILSLSFPLFLYMHIYKTILVTI